MTAPVRTPSLTRPGPNEVVWALPVAVYVGIRQGVVDPESATAAVLAAGVVVVASRSPVRALAVLTVVLPLSQVLLAIAFRLGAPAAVIRNASGWKEALLAGVVLAAVRDRHRRAGRLGRLDLVAVAYLAWLLAYLVVPAVFVSGELEPFDARVQSFRTHGSLVIVFLAARRLDVSAEQRLLLIRAALVGGAIAGGVALYEFAWSDAWNRFVLQTLELGRFRLAVFDQPLPNPADIRFYDEVAGRRFTRVGSVAFDPVRIAFYFVLPVAVGLELLSRGWSRRGLAVVGAAVSGAAVVLTFTRSAILAAAVAAILALRPAPGRHGRGRVGLALGLVAVLALAVPGLAAGGLGARVGGGLSGEDPSAETHVDRLRHGIDVLFEHPAGLGLATGPSVDQRFAARDDPRFVNAENSYLLVGNEVGVVPMALFSALLLGTLAALARRRDDPLAAALRCAGIGLAVGGLFLHVWIDLHTAVAFWGTAGVALARGPNP